ncbi:unnamed protein product [Fraxinus pennsylvanica]|uniref:Uncharacterized protein n=1 Tax=Fraxinus pennsylvanica TaxID=56036 RepID=A0AAD1Z6N5_9LAMI|nr:unnamed protein product [Fraxinus pennsylvanica]
MPSYDHHLIPSTPLQSVCSRPPYVYQRFTDGMPRHRSGTGTYLPNPKFFIREHHSSGNRRGNYNYDRNDNHGDREGNQMLILNQELLAHSYNRNQTEKSYSRSDRVASSENRADWSWRHDKVPSFQSLGVTLPPHQYENQLPEMKGRQGERVRLYLRGTILGYKRPKSNQYPNTLLIQIEGVNTTGQRSESIRQTNRCNR